MPRDTRPPAFIAAERYGAFVALLRSTELSRPERILTGWADIHAYLTRVLRLRRRNGCPLTLRQLRRWRERQGLPVGGGGELILTAKGLRRTLCFTTTSLLQAWAVSRVKPGKLFAVDYPIREAWHLAGVREGAANICPQVTGNSVPGGSRVVADRAGDRGPRQ